MSHSYNLTGEKRVGEAMKIQFRITVLAFLSVLFVASCQRQAGFQRKIRLSDRRFEMTGERELATTIYLKPQKQRCLAVLFFRNQSGDAGLDWLQKGLPEMFIRDLSQSKNLTVLSTERIYEIMRRLDILEIPQVMDPQAIVAVAREAGAYALLMGELNRTGDSLKISVQMRESGGKLILEESDKRTDGMESLFRMVDGLSGKIKKALQVSFDPAKSIADLSSKSLEAWRHYTAGMDLVGKLLQDEAIPEFETAVGLDSGFVSAYYQLAQLYLERSRISKAVKTLEKLKSLRELASPKEQFSIDILYSQIDEEMNKSIALFEKMLEQFPDDEDATFALANFYFSAGNYDKAEVLYKKILSLDPHAKLALNQLGYSYAYRGDFETALKILSKYQQMAPEEPNPYDSMGEILFIMGDFDRAEKSFWKALDVNPNFSPAYEHLGHLYLDRGHYRKALLMLKKAGRGASEGSFSSKFLNLLAVTRLQSGDRTGAIQEWKTSLEQFPFQNTTPLLLAKLLRQEPDSLQADLFLRNHYRNMMKQLNTGTFVNRFALMLGSYSLATGIQIDRSIHVLDSVASAFDRDSYRIRSGFIRALLLLKQNRQDEAVELLTALTPQGLFDQIRLIGNVNRFDPWDFFIRLNLFFKGHPDETAAFYGRCIELANQEGLTSLEASFRLLLSDLLYASGKTGSENQWEHTGTPPESCWKIIGPFDRKDGFSRKYAPEKNLDFEQAVRSGSRTFRWQAHADSAWEGYVDLCEALNTIEPAVGYAALTLESPDSMQVQIRTGVQGAMRMWLNGSEIRRINQDKAAILDESIIRAGLARGGNRVLVKICSHVGNWGFYFRVTDETGRGIPEIRFLPPDDRSSELANRPSIVNHGG